MVERKSDKQFLAGVYTRINKLQLEEREMERVREKRRKRVRYNCKFGLLVLLINVPFLWLFPKMFTEKYNFLSYCWSGIIIILATIYQFQLEAGRDS